MMKLLRAWGFPVGLLTLWAIAAAYTLQALIGMQSAQVRVMAASPVVIQAPQTGHAS